MSTFATQQSMQFNRNHNSEETLGINSNDNNQNQSFPDINLLQNSSAINALSAMVTQNGSVL